MSVSVALALGGVTATASAAESESHSRYLWPLEASRALSSTFGEFRRGHFHAGIDLKTWGQRGLPVSAIAAGDVRRVRASPWGYGKAVYLRLNDGRYAVYAHLEDFASPIREVLEARQEQRGHYQVDFELPRGQIRVRAGDVIGWTGDTGAGPPHLHFELRDNRHRPLNPLEHGFSVTDTRRPRIRQAALIPLDRAARVDGQLTPVRLPLRSARGDSIWRAQTTPVVWGTIGVAVQVDDRADAAGNRLAPYALELRVDGDRVFAARLSRFAYHETHKSDLVYNYALRALGAGTFMNFFVATGNDLEVVTWADARGGAIRTQDLGRGRHAIEVYAQDALGNRSFANLDILVDRPPRLTPLEPSLDDTVLVVRGRVSDPDDDPVTAVLAWSKDDAATWHKLGPIHPDPSGQLTWRLPRRDVRATGNLLIRAVATDELGAVSLPVFAGFSSSEVSAPTRPPLFHITAEAMRDALVLTVNASEPLGAPPEAVVHVGHAPATRPDLDQVSLTEYRAVLPQPMASRAELRAEVRGVGVTGSRGRGHLAKVFHRMVPKKAGRAWSQDRAALFEVDPGDLFEPLLVHFEPVQPSAVALRAAESAGLSLAGHLYHFVAPAAPWNGKATVRLRCTSSDPDPTKLGMYRLESSGKWTFVGGNLGPDSSTVAAAVTSLSAFAVLQDDQPPRVWDLQPRPGSRSATAQPTLFAKVEDPGSGIGRDVDIYIKLDDERVISVYDPEDDSVSFTVREPLPAGRHTFQIVARDRAGNEARVLSTFTVPPQAITPADSAASSARRR